MLQKLFHRKIFFPILREKFLRYSLDTERLFEVIQSGVDIILYENWVKALFRRMAGLTFTNQIGVTLCRRQLRSYFPLVEIVVHMDQRKPPSIWLSIRVKGHQRPCTIITAF